MIATDPDTGAAFVDDDGAPLWAVFRSTGSGFEDLHSAWSVPDALISGLWSTGGGAAEGWTSLDMDGDGCLDLVLTAGLDHSHPEAGDETWSWRVYRGE